MQNEIKIKLDFNDKYYYGMNFHNNKLKYLTVNDLVYIFKDLMSFYDKKGIKEPIKVDENYNEYYTLDRADWFKYNNDLKYKIYNKNLFNPCDSLIPELLKAISIELSEWGSEETHLSIESLLKIRKHLTLNQFIELLNHIAYPYYISYVCESECWFGFIEIKIIETSLGLYLYSRLMGGDGEIYKTKLSPLSTKDNINYFSEIKTIRKLKDFIKSFPDETEIPQLILNLNIKE